MSVTEGVFPLLLLLLVTVFAAGVALDHAESNRRSERTRRGAEDVR